eukprot:13755_1
MSEELKLIPKSKWIKDNVTNTCNECNITIKSNIFKTNKHHCRYCGHIICSNCSSNRLNKHIICTSCMHSNVSDNTIIQTYSKLINMGFADDISLKAAHKYHEDMVKAIDYLLTCPTTESDENTKCNDRTTDCNTDVKLCQSVQRIIQSLKMYQNNDTKIVNELQYKNAINDYHHILTKHIA